MTNAVLHKKNLRNYDVIPEEGTFIVAVSNTVKPEYLIEDGSKSRYIINLKASTLDKFKKCVDKMGSRESIAFEEVKNYFLSGVIWENKLDDITTLPVKGEKVIATFEKEEDDIWCVSITLIPRKKLEKLDLDELCQTRSLFKDLLIKRD